ncbi:hypothetical protein, partial [Paenibacillus xylanexedens]|uniref:hypothetical protein n=1 Tax=Paenibacillus xylanexedens TaxID=528191 RepID=UPI0028E67891
PELVRCRKVTRSVPYLTKACFAEEDAWGQKVICKNFYANCLNASVAVNSRQTTTKTLIRGE